MIKYLISLFVNWASGIPSKIISEEETRWVIEDLKLRKWLKNNE